MRTVTTAIAPKPSHALLRLSRGRRLRRWVEVESAIAHVPASRRVPRLVSRGGGVDDDRHDVVEAGEETGEVQVARVGADVRALVGHARETLQQQWKVGARECQL